MMDARPPTRLQPPSDSDWDNIKSIVTQVYWINGQTLESTIDLIKKEHGFLVTYVVTHDCCRFQQG